MDDRRPGVERPFHVDDRHQLPPPDVDGFDAVFGLRPGLGDDGGDRLALPAGLGERDGVLGLGLEALQMAEDADPGRAIGLELGAGDDGDDARALLRGSAVDRLDQGMGVGRADERDMHHARQSDVVDESSVPL